MNDRTATTSDVRKYPFDRASSTEPPAVYEELRAQEPVARVVFPSGDEGYVVSRYEDVRTVLGDARFSRAATVRPDAPRLTTVRFESGGLFTMDPPEHTRLRALVSREFTPRRVEAMLPRIEAVTSELLDAMEARKGPVDLADAFAAPLPIAVICELLGVPPRDRADFGTWSAGILSITAHTQEEVLALRGSLFQYLNGLVAAKRENPGEDLLSALVSAHDEEDRLSGQELLTMLMTLLVAGYETTASVLGNAVFTLLRNPGSLAALADDPARLERAVEELLRVNPIGDGGPLRVTLEDVEVAGTVIPEGSAVIASVCAANQDGLRFPDPEAYCPARADGPHLAFGHGPHFCLGAPLARAELRIALSALARRLPGLRLAVPADQVRMRTGLMLNRLEALPVTW
ncbi:cytochrome P450 [Wenjunlia tyrosinilytica]|uniref:Cytochrome P450 n=1 Tax=Wenjunlia tyrosinilytica TaxID=1544741 RepID=A0A917ZRW8_9ACTN|nr:cytochrome P450 [Wenjunlia tyrosinilytica]GGO89015.1 cytochrome P450 [Wenjunlia tyrosinilytica]